MNKIQKFLNDARDLGYTVNARTPGRYVICMTRDKYLDTLTILPDHPENDQIIHSTISGAYFCSLEGARYWLGVSTPAVVE